MQYVKSYADPGGNGLLVVNESPTGDWAFNFFETGAHYVNRTVRRGTLMWAKQKD